MILTGEQLLHGLGDRVSCMCHYFVLALLDSYHTYSMRSIFMCRFIMNLRQVHYNPTQFQTGIDSTDTSDDSILVFSSRRNIDLLGSLGGSIAGPDADGCSCRESAHQSDPSDTVQAQLLLTEDLAEKPFVEKRCEEEI